jgi:hypothetical protein
VREVRSEIDINAPPDRIWEVLTDFRSYPEWNPFITLIDGEPVPGSGLEVRIEPPGGRAMTFKPTVLAAEPTRELSWLGRLFVPGLFDGEHHFEIEPIGGERSRFVQREIFRGLLVSLFAGTLTKTEQGFEQMNRALKARSEFDASS